MQSKKQAATQQQYEALFPKEWTAENVPLPDRDGSFFALRLVGQLYFLGLALTLILVASGVSTGPESVSALVLGNPVMTVSSVMFVVLMAMLALTAAYNRALRWHGGMVLLVGHAIAFVSFDALYLFGLIAPVEREIVLPSAIGVVGILSLFLMLFHRQYAGQFRDAQEFPEFYSLAHRLMKGFLQWTAQLSMVLVVLLLAFRAMPTEYHIPEQSMTYVSSLMPLFLGFIGGLSVLLSVMASSETLREYFYRCVLAAFGVGIVCGVVWLFLDGQLPRTARWYLGTQALVLALLSTAMVGLRRMYYNIEYSVSAVSPSTAQNVLALHNALYSGAPEDHAAILQSIDRHVAGIRGRKRGLLNFPFALLEYVVPLLSGVPTTFSAMSRDEQRSLLRRRVLRPPEERAAALIPSLSEQVYRLGTAAHALITLAHFSNLKGRQQIGYTPPDARDRLQGDAPKFSPPFKSVAPLPDTPEHPANFRQSKPATRRGLVAPRVVTPVREPDIPDEVDYLVVGSGAGGAVMAYRLASRKDIDPSRILVVERGPRYSPLQDFNDDEMEMVRKLYKEGGLQQTKRFDLIVLQGECVGGTTVINNAVCFPMPGFVREMWQEEYDINLSGLTQEYQRVAREIDIGTISQDAINQRVKKKFTEGVRGYNAKLNKEQKLLPPETLKANFRDPLGTGLANIGNKRMRKRSMLETFIPWSEGRGVNIVSETSAVRFLASGRKANAVLLRTDLGNMKKVKVNKAVVIAGGTIASSHFLMRSGIGGNVGRALSCNFAFPMAMEFEDRLDAFDGVQMTLGALDSKNRAVFETYFSPPGAFAISIPFYFDRLHSTMTRYRHLVNFASLVGSEPNGLLERQANWIDGRAFTWELGEKDLEHIKYAFATLVEIGKAAGALRAILPLEPGLEVPLTKENVVRFKSALAAYPLQTKDLRLTTAHPQGGNRMMGNNSRHRSQRVVDGEYRVDGLDNVFVADASLFPTGITVNPQWTIMAMSSMASQYVP